jgi:hypothetical protein
MSLLWFRRAKRRDAKQEPEPTVEPSVPAAPQVRAPLRIKGLLLLNLSPSAGVEQIETAPPLGSRSSVIGSIQAAAPGIEFTDGRGEIAAGDHRITFDIGADDPVAAAVAAAEGDAGLEMLGTLLRQTRWRAYAPRAGVFIEPESLDLFALPDIASPPARP